MKDEDIDDDQTSTRLRVHDKVRVLESGKSVIMIAWRAGMWRRNLKVGIALIVIVIGIVLWKNHNNKEVTPAAATDVPAQEGAVGGGAATAGGINYEQVGRGLVYSCTNKTFHCLDKDNYYKCRVLAKSGKAECLTRGVLETTALCLEEAKGKKSTKIKCP